MPENKAGYKDRKWISKKIELLIGEGYKRNQAISIAFSMNKKRKR